MRSRSSLFSLTSFASRSTTPGRAGLALLILACPMVAIRAGSVTGSPQSDPSESPRATMAAEGSGSAPGARAPDQEPPPDLLREIARDREREERLASLRAAANARPDDVAAQGDYLSALVDLEKTEDAMMYGYEAVRRLSRSPDLLVHFGRALTRNGTLDLARLQFQRALELDPAHVGALAWAGRIDMIRGDLRSAEASYRKGLKLDADRRDVRSALASILERTGRYAEALVLLQVAQGKDAKTPGASRGGDPLTGRRALLPELAKEAPLAVPGGFTSITVPFVGERGFPPSVKLKLGDGLEKQFLIDTGSDEMVLTRETARALGLPERGKATIKDEEGREYPTPAYALLDRVAIGTLTVKRVPARVAPGLRYPDTKLGGTIGRGLLGRFRVVLDYPAKSMTLRAAGGPPLAGVPFDLSDAILVDGVVGEELVGKFVIDPSSYTPGPLDFRFVAAETGLVLGDEGVQPLPEGPYLFTFTMPSLTVLGVEFSKFPATAVDLRLQGRKLGVDVRGIIGNSLLRDLILELDLANQRILLSRPARPSASPG